MANLYCFTRERSAITQNRSNIFNTCQPWRIMVPGCSTPVNQDACILKTSSTWWIIMLTFSTPVNHDGLWGMNLEYVYLYLHHSCILLLVQSMSYNVVYCVVISCMAICKYILYLSFFLYYFLLILNNSETFQVQVRDARWGWTEPMYMHYKLHIPTPFLLQMDSFSFSWELSEVYRMRCNVLEADLQCTWPEAAPHYQASNRTE